MLSRKPRKRGGKALKRGPSAEPVPVLIARDREGRTADYILPVADKKHDSHRAGFARGGDSGDLLKPLMADDAILCTGGGGHGVFAAVAKDHGLTHRPVNVYAGIRVRAKVTPCAKRERLPAASKNGCTAFMEWLQSTCIVTLAGDACLNVLGRS